VRRYFKRRIVGRRLCRNPSGDGKLTLLNIGEYQGPGSQGQRSKKGKEMQKVGERQEK